MTPHPLIEKAQQQQPRTISIYWNGQQILRVEDGAIVLEEWVEPGTGLLTFHFDDDPRPVYVFVQK